MELMLRRRIEKLEAHLPVAAGRFLERLDRQALNALSFRDRELVNEVFRATKRKAWSPEHETAIKRFDEASAKLMQDFSDEDLESVIEEAERELGRPIPKLEAIA
jgi:hypothetical protein